MHLFFLALSLVQAKPKASKTQPKYFKGEYGYKMVLVKPGSFSLGGDAPAEPDEIGNKVEITRSLYVGSAEVTRGFWKDLTGEDPTDRSGSDCFRSENPVNISDDFPVFCVDWFEVIQFANDLSRWEGFDECYSNGGETVKWVKGVDCNGYRLPTETEWEYIARGGKSAVYAGSKKVGLVGWHEGNSGKHPNPVAQKDPNPFEIYDMSGNVWEWTWDWYGDYSDQSQKDPTGPEYGTERVLRGGSWGNSIHHLRVGNRFHRSPNHKNSQLGFRLVRTAPGKMK